MYYTTNCENTPFPLVFLHHTLLLPDFRSFYNSIRTWRTIRHTGCPKKGTFWIVALIMLESDVIIFQECILNYGRIKSSNSESTFFGTLCILMLFVIANCFLLLATSLHAPSTLTFNLEVNTLCQYLPIVLQRQPDDVDNSIHWDPIFYLFIFVFGFAFAFVFIFVCVFVSWS